MARRVGFEQVLRAGVREFARQQRLAAQRQRQAEREAEAAYRLQQRQAEQARRRYIADAKLRAREEKAAYLEEQEEEAERRNSELSQRLDALATVLTHTLGVNDAIDFDSLRSKGAYEAVSLPETLRVAEPQPDIRRHIVGIRRPGAIGKLLPWVRRRFEAELESAKLVARQELVEWQSRETERKAQLPQAELERETKRSQFVGAQNARNAEVDAFEEDCGLGDPDALVAYFSMVLERSEYPEAFPQNFSVALQAQSRLLVIRYELPGPAIVPDAAEYRYVRARDAIDIKPRKPAELKAVYADVIAAIVLRTIHEVFEADVWSHLEAVAINGMVKAVDPATGRDIEPCLVSVCTTRDGFLSIDLKRIDKAVCLRISARKSRATPTRYRRSSLSSSSR